MPPADVKEQLLKQIRSSIGDKSWRVRYMASTHFNEVRCPVFNGHNCLKWPQLAEVVGIDLVREELIGQYVQLLKDSEAEVRTAAAGQIPGMNEFFYALHT